MTSMGVQWTVSGSALEAGRTHFSRRATATVLMAIIALGAIAWPKSQKSPAERRAASIAKKIDYQALAKRHVDKALSLGEEAHNSFRVALAKVVADHEPEFANAAVAASRKASDLKTISRTLYCLARDQLNDEKRAEDYLTGEIGSQIDSVVAAFGRDVGAEMSKLETELRRISVQLAVDLAALGPGDPPKPQRFDPEADLNREFKQALRSLGLDAAGAGVALAFDGFAIANSRVGAELIKRLVAISSVTFAAQVGRLLGSSLLAAADGPLAIGDILAAIGVIWTVYDVFQIQPHFQRELRVAIQNRFDDVRAETNSQATDFAAGRVSKFKELQLAMGSKAAIALSAQEGSR